MECAIAVSHVKLNQKLPEGCAGIKDDLPIIFVHPCESKAELFPSGINESNYLGGGYRKNRDNDQKYQAAVLEPATINALKTVKQPV